MPLAVSLTIQDLYTKLAALLTTIVPVGVEVIQGRDNRVPMPSGSFVSMLANVLKPVRTPETEWDDVNPTDIRIEQGTSVRIQLDMYGPGSSEWAVATMTVFRNDFACAALAPMAPLYCDDPKQAPLVNGEEQYEERWIVDAHMQYNPVVSTPMQFANAADVELINVDERYPPS